MPDGHGTLADCGIAAGATLHLAPPLTSFRAEAPHGGFQPRPQLEGRLRRWLAAERPTSAFVLWGLGGSGKSTLARSLAHAASRDECGPAGEPLRLVFMLSADSIEQDYAGLLGGCALASFPPPRALVLSGRGRPRVFAHALRNVGMLILFFSSFSSSSSSSLSSSSFSSSCSSSSSSSSSPPHHLPPSLSEHALYPAGY